MPYFTGFGSIGLFRSMMAAGEHTPEMMGTCMHWIEDERIEMPLTHSL
jgi:hypothetical protein